MKTRCDRSKYKSYSPLIQILANKTNPLGSYCSRQLIVLKIDNIPVKSEVLERVKSLLTTHQQNFSLTNRQFSHTENFSCIYIFLSHSELVNE